MPDPTDEELGIPESLEDPNIRAELRRSRVQARELADANARASQAERDAAFARAGVSDSPLVQQLAKGYEGENDPSAIRAYFDGLGVDPATGSAGSGQSGPSDDELASQRQVAQVGAQGEAGGDVRFEDAIGSAKNSAEVMALLASAPEGATTNVGGRDRRIGPPTIE
jgi:hypothetical protein